VKALLLKVINKIRQMPELTKLEFIVADADGTHYSPLRQIAAEEGVDFHVSFRFWLFFA